MRKYPGKTFEKLTRKKDCEIQEDSLKPDDVHMLIYLSRKYAVTQMISFLKGENAIHIARSFGGRKKNFIGQHFWTSGYHVSTIGQDEQAIREYIQKQGEEDQRIDLLITV